MGGLQGLHGLEGLQKEDAGGGVGAKLGAQAGRDPGPWRPWSLEAPGPRGAGSASSPRRAREGAGETARLRHVSRGGVGREEGGEGARGVVTLVRVNFGD